MTIPSDISTLATSDDGMYCVVTGCIARELLAKPSFSGVAVPYSKEFYELTIPYARVMAKRLKGKPFQVEHEEFIIGEILHSWIDEKNQWMIKALIDRTTRSGNDMILAILKDPNSTIPMAQLSLTHQGHEPLEVSLVVTGARDGSTIDQIEMVDASGLDAIKSLDYNVKEYDLPPPASEIPVDTPTIRATQMSTYAFTRAAPTPTQYIPNNGVSAEVEPILKNVNAMREKNNAQNHMHTEQTEQDLERQLAQLRARKNAKQEQGQQQEKQQQDNSNSNSNSSTKERYRIWDRESSPNRTTPP